MDYIIIPTQSKTESEFFMNLLKKMHKKASVFSTDHLEDIAFVAALKEAELSGIGSISNAKDHLTKIVNG